MLLLVGCGGGGSTDGSGSGPVAAYSPFSTAAGLSSGAAALPAVNGWPQFVYPTSGQLSVDPSHPIQWSQVDNAYAYQLQIGTSPGANDVFDSGAIASTSISVPGLPQSGVLYARVRAVPKGWSPDSGTDFSRAEYATFRTDSDVKGATFIYPANAGMANAATPISWTDESVAQGYRLTLGSTAGGLDLLDTGWIHTTLRVAPGLPAGITIYATLYTAYANNIQHQQKITFTVGDPSISSADIVAVARTLAANVREMADTDNQPHDLTPLVASVASEGDAVADCTAFTNTLLKQLADANITLQSRSLSVCFNTNSYDCHELVEIYDPDSTRWVTLDPTFGLYAVDSAGQPATAQEISDAARSMNFAEISYQYLTPSKDAYARAYYIDYPLLFLNVYQSNSQQLLEPQPSVQPYFDLMGTSVAAPVSNYYAVQCASGSGSATAIWDGAAKTYTCTDGFTPVFWALAVATGDPSAAAVWRLHRFVFQ
ncbi:MAG TPA: hypothetical protein VIC29_13955 [Steroidobacteraceae bacterium]|jgi:hypothetical protein